MHICGACQNKIQSIIIEDHQLQKDYYKQICALDLLNHLFVAIKFTNNKAKRVVLGNIIKKILY